MRHSMTNSVQDGFRQLDIKMGNLPVVRDIPQTPHSPAALTRPDSPFAVGIAIAMSTFMDTLAHRRRRFGTAAWLWVVLATGLQAQTSGSGAAWPIPDAPASLRPAIARADAIIAAMHDALLWELTSGLQQGGATLAIKSCHIDSDRVAQRVGREEGVAAGRTSDRLRNPTNAPKSWAAPIVKANAGRRAKDVAGFAVDLGEKLGVLRPIAEQPRCAACHGPADKFITAVHAELKDRYPADRAVGFNDGDIRGWYWVEIPKQPRR